MIVTSSARKVFQFTQHLLSKREVSVVSSCCRDIQGKTVLKLEGVKKCGCSEHLAVAMLKPPALRGQHCNLIPYLAP